MGGREVTGPQLTRNSFRHCTIRRPAHSHGMKSGPSTWCIALCHSVRLFPMMNFPCVVPVTQNFNHERRTYKADLSCREQRREKRRREKEKAGKIVTPQEAGPDLMAGLTAEEMHMMQSLGLPFGFESTQGTLVEDAAANESAVKVSSQRKARQFMNRKGGFNRLLPAEQTGKKMQEV